MPCFCIFSHIFNKNSSDNNNNEYNNYNYLPCFLFHKKFLLLKAILSCLFYTYAKSDSLCLIICKEYVSLYGLLQKKGKIKYILPF